jgi:phage terminase small subunit
MTEKKVKPRTKAGTSKRSAEQKREMFVEAFFANGENASQAAVTAGFSPKTAGVTGAKMLKDPRILLKVESRRKELVKDTRLNTERLCQEIARLALSDPRRIMHPDGRIKMPHELDDDTAAAIASFEIDRDGAIKYKFWDKNSAQERAAKIVGAFERDNEQKNGDAAAFLLAINNRIVGVAE